MGKEVLNIYGNYSKDPCLSLQDQGLKVDYFSGREREVWK